MNLFIENNAQYWPNSGPVPAIINGPIQGHNGNAGLMLVSYNPFRDKLKLSGIGPVLVINNGPMLSHNGNAMAQYWQLDLAHYRRRCAKLNVADAASLYWANAPALIGPILAHYWYVSWVMTA